MAHSSACKTLRSSLPPSFGLPVPAIVGPPMVGPHDPSSWPGFVAPPPPPVCRVVGLALPSFFPTCDSEPQVQAKISQAGDTTILARNKGLSFDLNGPPSVP